MAESRRGREEREEIAQPIGSMLLSWVEDPPALDDLDGYYCAVCGQPIGWQIDTDDYGQPVGGFVAYLLSTLVDSTKRTWQFRYCEDCMVHIYEEMGI